MAENSSTKTGVRIRAGSMDRGFLVLVLILVGVGLVMVFSASYANAFYFKGNSMHFITRQFWFAVAGIVLMLVISRINYRLLRVMAWAIYLFALLLLVVVLFMPPLNNARRWIIVGPINFQPSEIAKFAVIVFFAHIITGTGPQKMKTVRHGVAPFVLALAPIVYLMLQEPHLSGTVLILAIGLLMMFIGGTDVRWFFAGAVAAAGGIGAVIFNPSLLGVLAHYAGERVTIWLDPFSDPLNAGFQTVQSLYAIGSGGLLGTGIGASRQKYLYLPEPHNDFIFAIAAEELGFIGAVIIIILFVFIIWRGIIIAANCPERFGALVSAGLIFQVGLQAVLNIAVVTNTVPNTGISLPFFSYGGTSLLMLLCEMGVILSISRVTIAQDGEKST